jgi:hypothetical protein
MVDASRLRAVREARGNLELLGRLDGTLTALRPAAKSGKVEITVNYVDRPIIASDVTERRTITVSPVDPLTKGSELADGCPP